MRPNLRVSESVNQGIVRIRMSDESIDRERLRSEAEYVHQTLFGRSVPDIVAERYIEAHSRLGLPYKSVMQRIIERRLDLEAVEYALRNRRSPLTKKIQIMLYLAEAMSAYHHDFVNARDQRLRAWLLLAAATLRSLYKLAKGRILVHRHELI